ncbi:MAG TPA: c-type cytochrome [Terriglobia bacterium]|nr:c-type cytochrome [Terriglobia bacterium]
MKRIAVGRLLCMMLLMQTCGLAAAAGLGGKKKAPDTAGMPSAFDRAPASAYNLRNPYHGQPDTVPAGRKLFLRHCAQCHGGKAEGGRKAPPLRSSGIREAPDGILFWFLKNGNPRAGMPSWSGLPPEQRWQIVSFLKSLR